MNGPVSYRPDGTLDMDSFDDVDVVDEAAFQPARRALQALSNTPANISETAWRVGLDEIRRRRQSGSAAADPVQLDVDRFPADGIVEGARWAEVRDALRSPLADDLAEGAWRAGLKEIHADGARRRRLSVSAGRPGGVSHLPPPAVHDEVTSGSATSRWRHLPLAVAAVVAILAGILLTVIRSESTQEQSVVNSPDAPASSAGMVQIPAGNYPLGADKPDPNAAETLVQRVDVAAFSIDRFEVSNEDFKAFVDQTDASLPLSWSGGRYPADRATHPVKGVTFEWAQAYCTSLRKQLPTETQWEVAARGAEGRLYPWGDDPAAVPLPAGPDTYPVGSVAGNVSPFGVADLAGNVWEWVGDTYDRRVPDSTRVLRGGQNGWLRTNTSRLPVDPQASNAPTIAGFRCAATTVDPNATDARFGEYTKPPPPVAPTPQPLPEGVLTQDEFDDATSGWVEKSSEKFRFGYHPNGFFHLETKVANTESLAFGPVVPEPGKSLTVSTSAFVEPTNTDAGGTFDYGLAFRFDEQGRGLVFVVGPRTSDWKVCGRNPDGTYWVVAQANRSIPENVDLEVRVLPGDTYEFRIGGNVVHQRTIPGFGGTGTGVVLLSYANSKKAHIHFDRFAMSNQV